MRKLGVWKKFSNPRGVRRTEENLEDSDGSYLLQRADDSGSGDSETEPSLFLRRAAEIPSPLKQLAPRFVHEGHQLAEAR